MRPVDPLSARFPGVRRAAGHYESLFLKACDAVGGRGVWIRYTVHKRPGEGPTGSLWFTYFSAGPPRALKATVAAPSAGGGDWIRVGEASMRAGAAKGALDGISWDLRFSTDEDPLLHLPAGWMYRARLPRTKLASPAPAAAFAGSMSVDGTTVSVDGWRGTIGHNWGSEHAERWIWLHGISAAGDWLDVAMGRLALGPVTTPWLANGAVSMAGERHAVGGPGRRARVRETPQGCGFELTGQGVRVSGEVSAPRERFVGWVYADPDGGEHHVVNCSIADLRLAARRRGRAPVAIDVLGGAAYELGMRERDHGMTIQPFPDG